MPEIVIIAAVAKNRVIGKDNTSATEMPPRKPPQVSIFHAPLGSLKKRGNMATGTPTDSQRAASATRIATMPATR